MGFIFHGAYTRVVVSPRVGCGGRGSKQRANDGLRFNEQRLLLMAKRASEMACRKLRTGSLIEASVNPHSGELGSVTWQLLLNRYRRWAKVPSRCYLKRGSGQA